MSTFKIDPKQNTATFTDSTTGCTLKAEIVKGKLKNSTVMSCSIATGQEQIVAKRMENAADFYMTILRSYASNATQVEALLKLDTTQAAIANCDGKTTVHAPDLYEAKAPKFLLTSVTSDNTHYINRSHRTADNRRLYREDFDDVFNNIRTICDQYRWTTPY